MAFAVEFANVVGIGRGEKGNRDPARWGDRSAPICYASSNLLTKVQ